MKIAIISDIHSNNYALKAVLNEIDGQKVDAIICLGDLIGYLPNANETLNLLRQRNILCIKGNHEQRIMDLEVLDKQSFEALTIEELQKSASALYTNYILDQDHRKYLKNLPTRIELSVDAYNILFVHGSPRAIDEYMYEDSESTKEILGAVEHNVVVSGHIHIPFWRQVNKKHLVNSGSVGKPKHGNPNASYIIMEIEDGNFNVEIKEVQYELALIIRDILNNKYIPDSLVENIQKGID